MRNGLDLPNLISELEYLHENRRDFLVNTKAMTIVPPTPDEPAKIRFKRPDKKRWEFSMTPHMLTQLCNFVKVSTVLVDSIISSGTQREREALCHLLTVRLQENEAVRMIRTQQEFFSEPSARAFLSDRYRQIDNWPLTEALVPVIQANPKVKLVSSFITDTNLYLKVVNTGITGEAGHTQVRGKEVGDTLALGVIITNSEVGAGSVQVRTFLYRLACTNGMVVTDFISSIRKNHLGRVQKASAETLILEKDINNNEEFIVRVKEIVYDALNDEKLMQGLVKKFEETRKDVVAGDTEAMWEYIGKAFYLTADEVKTMMKYYLDNGDLNRFGVINAVTQYASRNKKASYDRITEIETIGGRILSWDKTSWKKASSAMLPVMPTETKK